MIAHALITARGGSKGLPKKNLRKINGISLVENSINIAKSSGSFKEIFCSSDSKEILALAKKNSICINRPKRLAGDKSTSESVVKHYLKFLRKRKLNIQKYFFYFNQHLPLLKLKQLKK